MISKFKYSKSYAALYLAYYFRYSSVLLLLTVLILSRATTHPLFSGCAFFFNPKNFHPSKFFLMCRNVQLFLLLFHEAFVCFSGTIIKKETFPLGFKEMYNYNIIIIWLKRRATVLQNVSDIFGVEILNYLNSAGNILVRTFHSEFYSHEI